jgi:4-amino-4-deoxychorismate lyase
MGFPRIRGDTVTDAPSTPTLVMIDKVTLAATLPEGAAPFRAVDPASNTINATDLGITRGDGIFEGLGVVDGHIQAFDAHLARLARSARMLDLPDLDLDVIAAAVRHSVELHAPAPFLLSKLVVTRGIEGSGIPTAWVHTTGGFDFDAERANGISVVLLDRGYRHDVAQTSPWLLQGAKTLSYAVNKSVLREAARRGADDVIFLSSDGYLLEGPSASLIVRFGNRVVTPRVDLGILEGTTQVAAFDYFAAEGYETSYELLTPADLAGADGLWLASSGRQIAPISRLDGQEVAIDRDLTDRMAARLLGRTA